MSQFFDPDSPLMKKLSFVFDLLQISMLFFICSLPILTIGASAAGLSHAMRCLHESGSTGPRDFFHGFRISWKKGTLIWFGLAVFCGALLFNLRTLSRLPSGLRFPILILTLFFLFSGAILFIAVFPLLSKEPSAPLGKLLSNALMLGILKLPKTVLLLLAALLPLLLFLTWPSLSLALSFLWIFFWPSILMYLAVKTYSTSH